MTIPASQDLCSQCLCGNRVCSSGKGQIDTNTGQYCLWKSPATRNRTRDHLIAASFYSQMLYQLSYSRLVCERSWLVVGFILKTTLARAETMSASQDLCSQCLCGHRVCSLGKAKSTQTQLVRGWFGCLGGTTNPHDLGGGSKVGPCRAKHRGSCKTGSYAPSMSLGIRMPRVLIV